MTDHPSHVIKKRTMIKDRVGCCRTSTYNLPAEGHIFGMKSPEQLEGAGNSEYIHIIIFILFNLA